MVRNNQELDWAHQYLDTNLPREAEETYGDILLLGHIQLVHHNLAFQ